MPLHSTNIGTVDRYELAAILAGLRLLQVTPDLPEAVEEVATDCHEFTPLGAEEIDELCERINAVTEFPWRDVTEDDAETAALEARVSSLFKEQRETTEEEQAEQALASQLRGPAPTGEDV